MKKQPKMFQAGLWLCVGAISILTLVLPQRMSRAQGMATVIYNDPNTRVYYPRIMEIRHSDTDNGALLATCEEYKRPTPVHPIYKSTDKGRTWTKIGEVQDTQHGWGMRYQPMLFELPQDVADVPKGTILCAGSAIPDDMSQTSLELYRSDDGGATWTYMSTVVQGGRASPNGREDPVWEPFLMLDEQGRLVYFESDERFPEHNQLLCHFVSEDGGYSWGPLVQDVSLGELRPGMPIIAALPNGRFIMVYEIVGLEGFPVYYKLSDDGLDWARQRNLEIRTVDNYTPGSTPYCVWTPAGGANGTIIVSGRVPLDPAGGDFVVNYNNGEGPWYRMRTPISYGRGRGSAGYSRSMVVSQDGKELYTVCNMHNDLPSRLNMTFFRIPLQLAFDWSYEITAGCSFKLMTTDADGVVQQPNREDASQKWKLTDAGDGYCRLVASDGKVLEVQDGSTADGAAVVLAEQVDSDSQKWQIRYIDEGFYKLTAKHSGKCLHVTGGSEADGAVIVQGPDDGSDAMKWRMDAVDIDDAWSDWEWVPDVY
jgi:hypothetical protein